MRLVVLMQDLGFLKRQFNKDFSHKLVTRIIQVSDIKQNTEGSIPPPHQISVSQQYRKPANSGFFVVRLNPELQLWQLNACARCLVFSVSNVESTWSRIPPVIWGRA